MIFMALCCIFYPLPLKSLGAIKSLFLNLLFLTLSIRFIFQLPQWPLTVLLDPVGALG